MVLPGEQLSALRRRLVDDCIDVGDGVRLSRTPLTAHDAAVLLNELEPSPWDDSYRYLNHLNRDNTVGLVQGRHIARDGKEDHPATGISWFGATAVSRLVGAQLPTLSQWRSMVRAHGAAYPWGDEEPTPERANYDDFHGGTTAVATFPDSLLGFRDLLGNVAEWCATERNPDEAFAVGGGWNKPIGRSWPAERRSKWKRIGTVSIGVRLVFVESAKAAPPALDGQ